MSSQQETSPFHICLDTGGSDPMRSDSPLYQEVKAALAEGRVPDPLRIPECLSPNTY